MAGWDKWTTADEIHHIKMLASGESQYHGQRKPDRIWVLERYIAIAREGRIWHGPGMNVDPGVAIAIAQDLLDDLKRRAGR